MHGNMSSFSSYNVQDRTVKVLCSRRAEHTYEVTIASDPENHGFNYSRSVVDLLPATEEEKFQSRSEVCWPHISINGLESSVDLGSHLQTPQGLQYDEEAGQATREEPHHVAPKPSFYFDPLRGQYRRASRHEMFVPQVSCHPPAAPIKTVRQKLKEFIETDEFFDEYSFLALMTLLLANMARLTAAIFKMGCTARVIVAVFVCVWRFMVCGVEDIMKTDSGAQVGLKCVIFAVQLFVIFVCIFFFFWVILIPVCNLLIGIVSNILYLFV